MAKNIDSVAEMKKPAPPKPLSLSIAGEEYYLIEHFKKSRRKIPPKDVLKLPGAGFLTKMSGRERATTDYLLVWYEPATKTDYYYAGEDFIIKHGGVIDFPEDIKQFVRKKCRASKARSSAGLS